MALSQFGWKAAWLAEVDVAASQVLAHHYGATAPVFPLDPDAPGLSDDDRKARLTAIKAAKKLSWGQQITNFGDMSRIGRMIARGEAEAPDALVGGTPCQSFSLAGLRRGLEDARGQLTLSFCALADTIDEVRTGRGDQPCVILWENVPGVLNHKDNPFGCFLAALAGEDVPLIPPGRRWTDAGVVIGPKRAVAWRIGNAEFFGLAQRRNRLYVVASAIEGFDPGAVLFEFDGVRRDSAPRRETGEAIAGTLDARSTGGGFPGTDGACAGHIQPHERRPDGLANVALQNVTGALSAGAHPRGFNGQDAYNDMLIPMAFGRNNTSGPITAAAAALNAHGGPHGRLDFESETFVLEPIGFSSKDYGADAAAELAPTMRAMNHAQSHPNAGGQIAVAYAVALRGREGGGTIELGDEVSNTLRASGGGGDKAYCVTGEVTHTLKADGFDGSEDGTGRDQPITTAYRVSGNQGVWETGNRTDALTAANDSSAQFLIRSQMAVRRLLPIECERLRGFPDNYTLVPIGKRMAADGPRYKQLGNSWAVHHVRWIGQRLDAELRRSRACHEAISTPDLLATYFEAMALAA
ncbi:DNA cytosine methyltransferase [Asticcacaulis sp. AC466]|uniref:DNA cytosine methyltransferase n=1 Tax=Asticcacaulis sp. AC466 TaxID=1282362 RepID=UPI0006907B1A|nr:DNA cytosine methyltransferase [Asticcacaulis sp. AC466]